MIKEIKTGALQLARALSEIEDITPSEYMELIKIHIPMSNYTEINIGWTTQFRMSINPLGLDFSDDLLMKVYSYTFDNLDSVEDMQASLDLIKRNRIKAAAFAAFVYAFRRNNIVRMPVADPSRLMLREAYGINETLNTEEVRHKENIWYAISQITIDKEDLRNGIADIQVIMTKLEQRIERRSATKLTGLEALYANAKTKIADLDEFTKLYDQMPKNALTSRTWGFELEVADAKNVKAIFGIEKGEDGSLRSYESNDDCDCDCDDCRYHSCDCDYCESNNEDPDHCGNSHCSGADSAEFRSVRGISRCKHYGLNKLSEMLIAEGAEMNDTCGLHIHVYAKDLEPKQIGHVLASYKWIENMIAEIAGREDVEYARHLTIKEIKAGMRSGDIANVKMRAVNTAHLNGRGTLEFRQMQGTLDYKRVTVWAWLVRGLVTCAKRGMQLKDLIQTKTLGDVIQVMTKFDYLIDDETPDEIIPGGQRDNEFVKLYEYKVMQ
jgi:hypothetical protein